MAATRNETTLHHITSHHRIMCSRFNWLRELFSCFWALKKERAACRGVRCFFYPTSFVIMSFTLRPWRLTDLNSLVHHANNAHIARNLTNAFPHPYTPDDGLAFIEMTGTHQPVRIFAIEVAGEAVGGIGVHPQGDVFIKNAELGYWLAEPYWGRGIVTGAVREITAYAFRHFDIDRLFARPFGSNIGSQRVLEKAGFTLEAHLKGTIFKNGTTVDELIYAIRRDEL